MIKSLIVLVLATFIFSTVALDLPTLIKDLFRDIFQYSSPEMQKEVVSKLTVACSGLESKDYGALQQEIAKGPVQLDFSKIGALCKDYNAGKINDKEFFFSVIGSAFPEKFELPKVNALERYNSIMGFLNRNKIVYFVILIILFVLLYLLMMDLKLFIITLTGISFSMGILILLPYAAIIAYEKFVGIDTTPLLASILGGNLHFDVKAIISVILLLILRTYSSFIIALGVIFLSVGIAGKFYSWKLRKQSKKAEAKIDKKSRKEEQKKAKEKNIKSKNKDEDADEAYKHRDRSTKEILDELEEIHKKKTKKD
ncbi:MAG: hypothetical protein Q8R04_06300 [Nanoarchaeota archaeon]|nr:hypothetical protein [Nanoarchaeota archaeon]